MENFFWVCYSLFFILLTPLLVYNFHKQNKERIELDRQWKIVKEIIDRINLDSEG